MELPSYSFGSSYKKLGYSLFNGEQLDGKNSETFCPFIKIVMLPAGYRLTVDFTPYETTCPTLFFTAPNAIDPNLERRLAVTG